MIIGNKITEKDDILVIETPRPFVGIKGFESINVNISTTPEHDVDYSVNFRISYDKILWSDYQILNDANVKRLEFDPNKEVYLEIKIQLLSEDSILEYNGTETNTILARECNKLNIPECIIQKLNQDAQSACCSSPQIVYNDCGCGGNNLFNPYSIMDKSKQIYTQLSSLVSNMFGFCVDYFKTEASQRSKDYILHEYSLEHVIARDSVKILIPDNQLPTREIQFNPLMLDYPVNFEVHIVKSEFQRVFGEDSRPEVHDYLYMQAYMNRMYEVDSVQEADDFGYTSSYWRVSLKIYEQRSAVKYKEPSLLDDTQELIFNVDDKFKEEVNNEIADIRKDSQLNDLTTFNTGGDWLREYIDDAVSYSKLKLYNKYNLISMYQYDLSGLTRDHIAVTYRNRNEYNVENEQMISFLFSINKQSNLVSDIKFLQIGELEFKYNLSEKTFRFGNLKYVLTKPVQDNVWYAVLLKIKDGFSSLYLYSFSGLSMSDSMQFVENKTCNLNQNYQTNECNYSLLGFNGLITNLRLWNSVCEESENIGVLSQNVIKDSHLVTLVDNGKESLPIINKYN